MHGPWTEEERVILKHLDLVAWTEEEEVICMGRGL